MPEEAAAEVVTLAALQELAAKHGVGARPMLRKKLQRVSHVEVGVLADLRLDVRHLTVAQKRQRIIGALCPDAVVAEDAAQSLWATLRSMRSAEYASDVAVTALVQEYRAQPEARREVLVLLTGGRLADLPTTECRSSRLCKAATTT